MLWSTPFSWDKSRNHISHRIGRVSGKVSIGPEACCFLVWVFSSVCLVFSVFFTLVAFVALLLDCTDILLIQITWYDVKQKYVRWDVSPRHGNKNILYLISYILYLICPLSLYHWSRPSWGWKEGAKLPLFELPFSDHQNCKWITSHWKDARLS